MPITVDEIAAALHAATGAAVERLETHVSVLLFAGDRVWKVKKALDLGFLDFRTPADRRRACLDEVRLNRRLAPDTYLGVAAIDRAADGGVTIAAPADHPAEAPEYAVVMRRLPAAGMFDRLLADGALDETLVRRTADLVASFHATCPLAASAPADEPRRVRGLVATNGDQARDALAAALGAPAGALAACVGAWCDGALAERADALAARAAAGRVVEGHGDLHLGNLCRLDDGAIVAYDCIEFSRELRTLDVAQEIAFLAMDLARRGRPDLAAVLVAAYAERAHDPEIPSWQPVLRTHLALVRAKVAALRAAECAPDSPERAAAAAEARDDLHFAARTAVGPALVVLCGLPGTGKSRWAERLAAALGARVVASDRVRKELLGVAPADRADAAAYGADVTARVYAAMADAARHELATGSIVLDATSPTAAFRAQLLAPARDGGDAPPRPWIVLHAIAPDATVRARLAARAHDPGAVSDADEAVYDAMRRTFAAPDEIDSARLVVADAETDEADVVGAALAALLGAGATPSEPGEAGKGEARREPRPSAKGGTCEVSRGPSARAAGADPGSR